MKLIYDRGCNCHMACVFSILDTWGMDYTRAFFNLWSERDFVYNRRHAIYESARIKENMDVLGIRLCPIPCTAPQEGQAALAQVETGELFVVGMDNYYIFWHPVYQHFHGLHYFLAQKTQGNAFPCGDPVYGQENAVMEAQDIENHAFELVRVVKTDSFAKPAPIWREAQQVLQHHRETKRQLEGEIQACTGEGRCHLRPLIGRVEAMINNRRLFQKYLWHSSEIAGGSHGFFTHSLLSRWEAAKNGLHKAAIVKDNSRIIDQVCNRLSALMEEEIQMAAEIAALERLI